MLCNVDGQYLDAGHHRLPLTMGDQPATNVSLCQCPAIYGRAVGL